MQKILHVSFKPTTKAPGMRPQMLIISRGGKRKLLNLEEVAAAATELGFNVTEAGAHVAAFAALVNAADVLLAVHVAGLTNQIFQPTQAVVLQIVPWGNMDWMATNFYGQPARDMQLRYVEYYVDEEESRRRQGWQALTETIMKQDVKVNLTRFGPFLLQVIDKLQE
ncbi:beta-1,2-xylosyltransferease XAX1-like [Triticum urartu]|uniref:beta-1,2-xylosyltransferease XAX1-like n=1 Tax=Triticum urartu TaxID=4572 RepID=UPI0020434A6B|nr:beta-1,2-xylosyltransferease XAX1-like [Triticum urartu]